MPDHIEGLYEKMMEQYLKPSQAWDRMDAFTAGWLHVYCKQQADLAMARLPDDLEKEMRVRFFCSRRMSGVYRAHYGRRIYARRGM